MTQPTPNTLADLIAQAHQERDDDTISQLQCAVMALAYGLYRMAAKPHGDNHEGLTKFVHKLIVDYDEFCLREEKE